jgi:hypothetical protein
MEGLADLRVLEAIIESAENGRVVQLEPFDRARRPDITQTIEKPAVEPPDPVNAPSPSR